MSSDLEVSLPSGYGVADYPPGASYGPRRMTDWEFVWLLQGDAEYHWGSRRAAAPEGSLVLCRPGATDFFQWDRARRTRHGYFHFQVRQTPSAWLPWGEWPLVRGPEDDDLLLPLFRHLLTWRETGDPDLCRQVIGTLLAAFRTGQRTTGGTGRDAWPAAVTQVCAYITRRLEEDPTTPLPLAVLAAQACVTPEHLCRLFKNALGCGPAETVRLARLNRAVTLLARSNYSVSEIAALCGFASPFHFSRCFKDAYGVPPRELRLRIEAGEAPPTSRLLRTIPSFRSISGME